METRSVNCYQPRWSRIQPYALGDPKPLIVRSQEWKPGVGHSKIALFSTLSLKLWYWPQLEAGSWARWTIGLARYGRSYVLLVQ